jgi:type II secretory pathway component PulK
MAPRGIRGSILLLILGMIVVMGYVLTQFIEKGLSEIAGEGYYVERDRLRIKAYGALEITLAVLADFIAIEQSLQSPAQGWGDPIGYSGVDLGDGVEVRITFTDESAKLPLNSLDEISLYLLFDEIGIPPDDNLLLTNSLLDWIDEDDETRIDGAETDEYGFREIPHRAANRPIHNLKELSVVAGFDIYFFDEEGRPNAIFDTFAEMVSPYGTGTLNANTAGAMTLRVAGAMSDPQIDAIEDYRAGADRIPGNGDDRYFVNSEELLDVIVEMPPDIRLGVDVSILGIEVQVSEGNSVFALKAVISLDGSGVPTVQSSSGARSSTGGQGSSGGQSSSGGQPTPGGQAPPPPPSFTPGQPPGPPPGLPSGRPPGSPGSPGSPPSSGPTSVSGSTAFSGSTSQSVAYPVVFLELTEDVSNNQMPPPASQEEEENDTTI